MAIGLSPPLISPSWCYCSPASAEGELPPQPRVAAVESPAGVEGVGSPSQEEELPPRPRVAAVEQLRSGPLNFLLISHNRILGMASASADRYPLRFHKFLILTCSLFDSLVL